jgi:hypothetical protein
VAIDNNNSFLNPLIEWRKNNLPVGVSVSYYSEAGLVDGDSISCIVTENGQQYHSNTLLFRVLGGQPKIHISTDKNTCLYSSIANYGYFLDFGNSLDDLSFGATTIVTSGRSNETTGIINLPFIFKFGGNSFDKFSVSSNGRMKLGNVVVGNSSDNTEAFDEFIMMPWWDELTTGNNGNVRYKVFVENEFAKLVIEWNVNASDINQPFDRTIQLRLVQDANNIIFLYNNKNVVQQSGSATVGIAGNSSDFFSVGIQSSFGNSTISSINRIDNNVWPQISPGNSKGIAFFNNCKYDSVVYGSPVVFTALIDSGGLSPVYVWKKNSVSVGTNSNTYVDSLLNDNDTVWCELSSQTTCTISSAISNRIVMNVKPRIYFVFNGSGNWSNSFNWSDGENHNGILPAGTCVVIAPSAGGNCIVDIPVTISRGAKLIIQAGANILIPGNLRVL